MPGALTYLAMIVVQKDDRRQGIATRLVAELFRRSAAERLGLPAGPDPRASDTSLPHKNFAGHRL